MGKDWVGWHRPYDEPGSPLAQRLAFVAQRLADALDAAPAGPVRLLSACAGQAHDVLAVLPKHPRRDDVTAVLVELDPVNTAVARDRLAAAGLADRVTVVTADAGVTTPYAPLVPAEVVLFCGVFGNVTGADLDNTVRSLPMLCAPGATVIWTRHRRAPDVTPRLMQWFEAAGFELVGYDTVPNEWVAVGTHRYTGSPAPYRPDALLFEFVGDGS